MKRSFALFMGVAAVHWLAAILVIGAHCAFGKLLFCMPAESVGLWPYVGLAAFSAGVTACIFLPIWLLLNRLERASVMSVLVFWFIGGIGVPLFIAYGFVGQSIFLHNPFIEIQLLTLSGAALSSAIFFCLQRR